MARSQTTIPQDWGERLRAAAAARASLRLVGAGTKDFYGESLAGNILQLGGRQGIVDYEASGIGVSARVHFLAFEPPAFAGDPSVGGVIAAGLSGPRRPYAGAARDFVLGAHLLGADGQLLCFGGQVMKNVAGFDVARLLCGSLGTLGIITQGSLKGLPQPRPEQTLRLQLPVDEAVAAFNRWAGAPLPLSGAAWWQGCAFVRLSGAAPAVRTARREIGGELLARGESQDFWDALRHCRLPPFAAAVLWRVSLPAATPRLPVAC